MAIKDTATDFELPQDNQIIFEDVSVADIENMLEGEVELLPIQADTKVSRLPTVETVEMLEEEVPLKPIKAEEITIPQPAASAVSAKMLLGLSALLGGGAVLAAAGKSSGGGESKKQPVSEKNVPQQDDRENNGDKAERPSENNPVHNNDQTAPARPKPDEAAGSKVTPPETPPVAEKTQITTHIYYPNGASASITSSEDMAFDMASLEYTEKNRDQDRSDKIIHPKPSQETLSYIQQHINANYQRSQGNLKSAFRQDTDGDGLVDAVDKYPTHWNVSDRDLRMFATLAYTDEKELKAAFNPQSNIDFVTINNTKFEGQADITEVNRHWEVLKFHNGNDLFGSGLDYVIFGNGKKGENEYENVVVAFRGTTNFQDYLSDAKIALGWSIGQAKELSRVAEEVAAFKPEKIYSTGHSLGGYLAQHFAAYDIQQNSNLKNHFERSVLFNTAILKTRLFTLNDALLTARSETDKLVKTAVYDDSNLENGIKKSYKTISYVIRGEVLNEFLGEYENSTFIDLKDSIGGKLVKHKLNNFYGSDTKLQQYFTQGYRTDTRYQDIDSDKDGLSDMQEKQIGTEIRVADTDRDGFSDGIEAKLKSDPQDADSTPFAVTEPAVASDEGMGLAIVQTEKADGSVVSVKGVEMTGTQEEGNTVYRSSENSVVDLGMEKIQSAADGVHQAVITVKGTAGDDIIVGSKGNDIIWGDLGSDTIKGNGGSDTIVFSAEDIRAGKVDTVTDFGRDDFLDLGRLRTLFSDHPENFKWENILDNTDISSSALVYKADEHTLAYRAAGSENANVFARFDEQAEVSASQFIG